MINLLLGRAAPYLLAATVALGATSFIAARGWLNEHKEKLEVRRDLDLARQSIQQSAATAERLRIEAQRATTRAAKSQADLAAIPVSECLDSAMPDDVLRLLNQAQSDTAAAASGRAD